VRPAKESERDSHLAANAHGSQLRSRLQATPRITTLFFAARGGGRERHYRELYVKQLQNGVTVDLLVYNQGVSIWPWQLTQALQTRLQNKTKNHNFPTGSQVRGASMPGTLPPCCCAAT